MFKLMYFCLLYFTFGPIFGQGQKPTHCTHVTKDTDIASNFKLDYPVVYIIPGQREAYQQLFCINPQGVKRAETTVCDWAAAPQVQFTLGDEYMHVVRQDPSGRFLGNAVITTYQLCNHTIPHKAESNINEISSTFSGTTAQIPQNYVINSAATLQVTPISENDSGTTEKITNAAPLLVGAP